MKIKINPLIWSLVAGLALAPMRAPGDFILPNYNHTQGFRNTTGKTANDLHVNLIHSASGSAPTAPPFPPGTSSDQQIDFAGASVPNNTPVTVSWQSKFASDTVDPTSPGNWTFDGTNIGNIPVNQVASLDWGFTDGGGGTVLVSVTNESDTNIVYSDLQIFQDADAQYFALSNFLSGLTNGTPVTLMVASDGTFEPGITLVAQFSPSTAPTNYSGGSVLINGQLLAEAGSTRYFGPPRFDSVSIPHEGQVQLMLSAEMGSVIGIQTAPDLKSWSFIGTVTNTSGGEVQYIDTSRQTTNNCFYRAVQLQ